MANEENILAKKLPAIAQAADGKYYLLPHELGILLHQCHVNTKLTDNCVNVDRFKKCSIEAIAANMSTFGLDVNKCRNILRSTHRGLAKRLLVDFLVMSDVNETVVIPKLKSLRFIAHFITEEDNDRYVSSSSNVVYLSSAGSIALTKEAEKIYLDLVQVKNISAIALTRRISLLLNKQTLITPLKLLMIFKRLSDSGLLRVKVPSPMATSTLYEINPNFTFEKIDYVKESISSLKDDVAEIASRNLLADQFAEDALLTQKPTEVVSQDVALDATQSFIDTHTQEPQISLNANETMEKKSDVNQAILEELRIDADTSVVADVENAKLFITKGNKTLCFSFESIQKTIALKHYLSAIAELM